MFSKCRKGHLVAEQRTNGEVLRKLLPATGVIWAILPQSWKKLKKKKTIDFDSFRFRFRLCGTHFWTLFQLWARRAQMTPAAGPRHPKWSCGSKTPNSRHTYKTRDSATRPKLASSGRSAPNWANMTTKGGEAKTTNGTILTLPSHPLPFETNLKGGSSWDPTSILSHRASEEETHTYRLAL